MTSKRIMGMLLPVGIGCAVSRVLYAAWLICAYEMC